MLATRGAPAASTREDRPGRLRTRCHGGSNLPRKHRVRRLRPQVKVPDPGGLVHPKAPGEIDELRRGGKLCGKDRRGGRSLGDVD